jgi:type I restriction enzyme S subunit
MSSFPEDWVSTTLGKVAQQMFGGGTPSTKNPNFWQGNIPWITSKSLGDSIYLTAGEKTISEEAVRKSATHIVPAGNLIFATRVGVGKVVVTKIDVAISQDSTGIVVDPTEVDPTFLAYQLRTDSVQRFVEQNKRGATIQGITRTSLQQVDVVIPPLPEQRHIAHVLSTVQTAIEQQARLIVLTRELKSALMRKLFTEGLLEKRPHRSSRPVRSQKMTAIGLVPESWEVVKIGDVFKFSSGKTRPSELGEMLTDEKPYPVYGGNGIMGYSSEYLLESPTLLLGRVGEYCGCAHHTKGRAWISDNALYAKEIKVEINSEFAAEYFNYANLNQYSNKAGQPLITQGVISAVSMPLPEKDEQDEIFRDLNLLNKKLELAQAKKNKLEELFRTLLHQLMTGL